MKFDTTNLVSMTELELIKIVITHNLQSMLGIHYLDVEYSSCIGCNNKVIINNFRLSAY